MHLQHGAIRASSAFLLKVHAASLTRYIEKEVVAMQNYHDGHGMKYDTPGTNRKMKQEYLIMVQLHVLPH